MVPRQKNSEAVVEKVLKGELLKEGLIQEASEEDTPTVLVVDNPSRMPDKDRQQHTLEPYVRLEVIAPTEYTGPLMHVVERKTGRKLVDMKYLARHRRRQSTRCPWFMFGLLRPGAEVADAGNYASMEYALSGYRESPLVRLDVMINNELAALLSTVVHEQDTQRLHPAGGLSKEAQGAHPAPDVQGAHPGLRRREHRRQRAASAMRKDVLAAGYGGDISRKTSSRSRPSKRSTKPWARSRCRWRS